MATIKNINILSEVLDEGQLKKLDKAAALQKKHTNTDFTLLSLQDNELTVETEQGQTSGNYASLRTLIKRTSEVFEKFLPGDISLKVNAIEYVESPSAVVTPNWIAGKMQEKEVRIRQMAFDTGLDRKDISGWISGERSMSQIVKAMFFFYFKSM